MTKSIVAQATDNERRYTEKQLKLLEEYRTNGFNGREAALTAGYRPDSVPSTLRSLKDELLEIAEMELVTASGTATKVLKDVMTSDKPIPQAQAKLSASNSVLDRVGLGKRDKMEVDHKVTGGIFIIPAKQEKVINE